MDYFKNRYFSSLVFGQWSYGKVTRIIHDKATELTSLCLIQEWPVGERENKELTTIAGTLSKEEGLTDEFTKVGGSIQNTECHV